MKDIENKYKPDLKAHMETAFHWSWSWTVWSVNDAGQESMSSCAGLLFIEKDGMTRSKTDAGGQLQNSTPVNPPKENGEDDDDDDDDNDDNNSSN